MKHHHRHNTRVSGLHHSKIHRKDAFQAVTVCTAILLLLITVFLFVRQWEDETYTSSAEATVHAVQEEQQRSSLSYKGSIYTPKEQIETYLVMGIDVSGPAVSKPGNYNGGQADAQFVIVLDKENETWKLLQLNRDSMVNVPVLGLKGEVVGHEYQQLALAHAYGEGTKTSCMNAANTVSTLLLGQPIDGYVALNMDGIAILNDMVGGVTVTVTSDFTAVDPTLIEGETITLHGEQAMNFVRSRANVDDQTNLARMERQRQYLEAMKPQLLKMHDEDIIQIYDALSDYLVTDLGSKNFLELAEKLQAYREAGEFTIEGNNEVLDGHMAYFLDEDSLLQVVLELFYQKNTT